MLQRGRKSSTYAPSNGASLHLDPPSYLNPKEREVFLDIAASAGHFTNADVTCLASLAQATLLANSRARDKNLGQWERAMRVQAMLMRQLRLTAQSRASAEYVARKNNNHKRPSYYDIMDWQNDADENSPT